MASPMSRVNSLVSADIGNYLTNVQTWGGILFNVKAYGAKGDGTTDDTAAIQSAIAAAPTGGIVFFPIGTYLVSSIIINKSIALQGVHLYSDIISNSSTANIITFGDNTTQLNNITIRDLVFKKSVVSTAGSAMYFQYCSGIYIDNVLIYGNNKIFRGITFSRVIEAWLNMVYFVETIERGMHVSGTGLSGNRSVDITVHECRFKGTGSDGIFIGDYTEGVFVHDSVFLQYVGNAINAAPVNPSSGGTGRNNMFFVNNNIEIPSLQKGITIDNVVNVEILDTWFGGGDKHIHLLPTSNSILIENNQLTTADVSVIDTSAIVVTISGNDINGGALADNGIFIQNNSETVIFNDNHIRGCAVGVRFGTNINWVNAKGNIFRDNTNDYAGISNLLTSGAGGLYDLEGNISRTAAYQVASAATVTLPENRSLFQITGTTTITSITASWAGREVTFIFLGSLTLTDGSNLQLAGDFVASSPDTIKLVCDGTNWFELSRSNN